MIVMTHLDTQYGIFKRTLPLVSTAYIPGLFLATLLIMITVCSTTVTQANTAAQNKQVCQS